MTTRPASSEELERLAIGILVKELRYWIENDLPVQDFEDDVVLEVLVEKGVRPSRLGCDLGHLVYLAKQRMMREGLHA